LDLLNLAFFVLLFGGSLIAQALKAAQERAKRQRWQQELEERALREGRGRGADRAGDASQVQPPAPPRAKPLPPDMARELEQLLGRLSGQPQPSEPPPARGVADRPARRPLSREEAARRAEPLPTSQATSQATRTARGEANEPEPDARHGTTVAEHVQQHLRPGQASRNTTQLGRDLAQADERMELHLQSTFDHRVGQLGGLQSRVDQGTDAAYWSDTSAAVPPVIGRVYELLDSPQDIRAVFLLSEILRRPEFD
jgi:hypothetical protein